MRGFQMRAEMETERVVSKEWLRNISRSGDAGRGIPTTFEAVDSHPRLKNPDVAVANISLEFLRLSACLNGIIAAITPPSSWRSLDLAHFALVSFWVTQPKASLLRDRKCALRH